MCSYQPQLQQVYVFVVSYPRRLLALVWPAQGSEVLRSGLLKFAGGMTNQYELVY